MTEMFSELPFKMPRTVWFPFPIPYILDLLIYFNVYAHDLTIDFWTIISQPPVHGKLVLFEKLTTTFYFLKLSQKSSFYYKRLVSNALSA